MGEGASPAVGASQVVGCWGAAEPHGGPGGGRLNVQRHAQGSQSAGQRKYLPKHAWPSEAVQREARTRRAREKQGEGG